MENGIITKPTGEPVNTKSLLAFLFAQMGKLDRKEITPNEAVAQAKLASQANNVLDYELKRTVVQMKLKERGGTNDNQTVRLREVESKVVDY